MASGKASALRTSLPDAARSPGQFFQDVRGAEIDLVLEQGDKKVAVAFKVSAAAKPQRGFWTALKDLEIKRLGSSLR